MREAARSGLCSLALIAVLGGLAACVQIDDVPSTATTRSALTPEECMESVDSSVAGRAAVCHRTFGAPPYVLINIAESACVNAHASNHPEDFLATDDDCSCVGDGQGCQEGAPCCSGNCDEGVCGPACAPNFSECEAGPDCCIGYCTDGLCCKGFRARCASDDDCCSGSCLAGTPRTCR